MSNLIPHQFSNIPITQLTEDTVIGGKHIPKGYVNLTQMCKAGKKKLNDWTRLDRSKVYLEALSLETGNPVTSLIIELLGTPDGDASLQGTWGHHQVALSVAAWISPKFEVWANKVLWAVINGDFTAQTAEAEEAQKHLQSLWAEIRAAGKVTRRSLTDAIKEWYERNPGATSRPIQAMCAHTTNAIYKALWNKTALEIEEILECGRNESRNHLSTECLKIVDRAEARVMEFIDEDNLKPVDAVTVANLKRSKTTISK